MRRRNSRSRAQQRTREVVAYQLHKRQFRAEHHLVFSATDNAHNSASVPTISHKFALLCLSKVSRAGKSYAEIVSQTRCESALTA